MLRTDTYNYNVLIIWMCITHLLNVLLLSLSIKNNYVRLLCNEQFDSLNSVDNAVDVIETYRLCCM